MWVLEFVLRLLVKLVLNYSWWTGRFREIAKLVSMIAVAMCKSGCDFFQRGSNIYCVIWYFLSEKEVRIIQGVVTKQQVQILHDPVTLYSFEASREHFLVLSECLAMESVGLSSLLSSLAMQPSLRVP